MEHIGPYRVSDLEFKAQGLVRVWAIRLRA